LDKKLFKNILLLVTVAILLVAVIVKLDSVLAIFSTVLSLLVPLFWGIGIAFVVYPMFVFFKKHIGKLFDFIKSKYSLRREKASKKPRKPSARKIISPEVTERLEKISLYRKEQRELRRQGRGGKKRADIAVTALSVIIAYSLLISVVAVTLLLLIPQLGVSLTLFADNLNSYVGNLQSLMNSVTDFLGLENTSLTSALTDLLNTLLANLSRIVTDLVPMLLNFTKNLAMAVTNIVIGLIMSVYMVLDKELIIKKISQLTKLIVSEKMHARLSKVMNLTSRIFSGYISSRLLDSLIIGIICYICMVIIGFDYALLISVVVGITNIIPVFGPFMGAIPSAFILLMVDPMEAVWFTVFILILQQIDGNIIGPKITGDSIGLPVIWTMIAILVGGGLFGILGMLFGVPAVAVVYTLVTDEMKRRNALHEEKTQKAE